MKTRPGRKSREKGPPEREIQDQVENYLDLKGVRYIRIPDQLFRWIYGAGASVPLWVRGLVASYLKGQPDLVLIKKMGNGQGCFSLPLELKRVGGKMSPEQLKVQEDIGTFVAYSFEEAVKMIDDFILLRAT